MQELPPLTPQDDAAKTSALVAYLCLVAGYFTGLFWLVGGIWAMVKRSDAEDSRYVGHFNNIISVFWWGAGLCILGVILAPFIIGYFILLGVLVWSVYRLIKGLALLTSNKPFPL
ncbi:DUF4870 family protein [Thalassolituus sp. LLYu03]|uniref:DUF4870 family protein n=1 Tax=Thalassolituus sp. LLYu03 TaxID=3421656 RepID=UPI003D2CA1B4